MRSIKIAAGAAIASMFCVVAHAAPLTIDLEYEAVMSGPVGPVNTTVPAGISVFGQLVIDDAVFDAPTSPFVTLTQDSAELQSLRISGSGFDFDGAASEFVFATQDFADIRLSLFTGLDLMDDLLGQPTGLVGPGGGPPSFALNFGTYDGQLSPVETALGLSAGTTVPFPRVFPVSGADGFIPFFSNPVDDPRGAGFRDVELIQFRLTGATAQIAPVPLPATVWMLLASLGVLAARGRFRA